MSVLALEDGPAQLSDGFETVTADSRLVTVGCLRSGTWYDASPALMPTARPATAAA